jgi:hypothetical protein
VVQAQAVFDFAVVVFDPPADLRHADQGFQSGVGGQVAEPVIAGFGGKNLVRAGLPFGQEPAPNERDLVPALALR